MTKGNNRMSTLHRCVEGSRCSKLPRSDLSPLLGVWSLKLRLENIKSKKWVGVPSWYVVHKVYS